ncbi:MULTISPECIES: holin family protein [Novosphingobium]|jgi:hypothetical protein|uniref:Holin of 3TMs, for gene-transfer release n=1 Tax=Novosphingobium subterraneum TaxID=48936 RepID=A0A0B9A107_9SPHN|nr:MULTISPECIES: holin family protein [Novosphingobium]KHS49031.1 hypothetical protein NJ75_00464 [Novosphingobium subterraneum]QOV95116.1 holin family protein [Novosphingobium sp. ES2-1]
MANSEALISSVSAIIDKIIPDAASRDQAKLELLRLESARELKPLKARISATLAESRADDPWTRRARPAFLYVMYAVILWALPMGLLAGLDPAAARAIMTATSAYLNGLPEPLYALFGTGYLGYTAARQWGKARGTDR